MATTINASNGSTSGLISTGDASGVLQLQVNNGTPALTLNTTQALGVGTSPSYGTSGQFLTSQGSGAAPTWTSAPSSAMTLISTQSVTGASTISFTGLSGYDKYKIIYTITPSTNAWHFIVIGTGSTPTYLTSNYYNVSANTYGTGAYPQTYNTYALGSPAGSSFGPGVPVKGTYPMSGDFTFSNFISGNPCMMGTFSISDANNVYMDCGFLGQWQTNNSSSTPITAIQIQMSGMTGKASLYGISS